MYITLVVCFTQHRPIGNDLKHGTAQRMASATGRERN